MCVTVFVDLGINDHSKHIDRSKGVTVLCEETIVPGVWDDWHGKTQAALQLAINPGQETIDCIYLMTLARVSHDPPPEAFNNTWAVPDDPFNMLFREFPNRSVSTPSDGSIEVTPILTGQAAEGIFAGTGVIATCAGPPELVRPWEGEDNTQCPFSILKIAFAEPLPHDKFSFVRTRCNVDTIKIPCGKGCMKWPTYGLDRVKAKCARALERLQGMPEHGDYAHWARLSSLGTVNVKTYSVQFAVDARFDVHVDAGDPYDEVITSPADRPALMQLVPPKERKGFTEFRILSFATQPEMNPFYISVWTRKP
jgi:hypothetical protein